jgi:hypothetical protein
MPVKLKSFFVTVILFSSLSLTYAEGQVLFEGQWKEKGYEINGGWKIVKRGETKIIQFNENFKTRSGPDLKLFLSSTPIGKLSGKIVGETSIKIGALISNKGAQEYVIPNEYDLADFRSLVIHCEAYSHLWGGADLK